ncbi:unnamed protein product [Clonostachys rhizophaga]|uniref:Cytochrome P450 n=1 Tax=Clonostachys rhizophaga TaxID=160324 RepID=A0A9N9W1X7_9HYPO|nr:unnamed protein product [Clonostachys rhizophaga]
MNSQGSAAIAMISQSLWVPAAIYLSLFRGCGIFLAIGIPLAVQSLFSYAIVTRKWHAVNNLISQSKDETHLPPQYPSLIPYVGSALSFVWDNAGFLRQATRYGGRLISSRISFLGFEIFAFQDRQTVAKVWKQTSLSSPISIFVYAMKYFFEIPENVLSVYRADTSGPFPKPHRDTNIPPQARVDHITHYGFLQALSGPGWLPTTKRCMNALVSRLEDKGLSEEWTEFEDMSEFFKEWVGASLIESLFGPSMLRINPTFVKNIWVFDEGIPWLARGVPSFLRPSIYKARRAAIAQIRNWYLYAREHFDESYVSPDGDGDPFWGSWLMRYRQKNLLPAEKHNDEVLSKLDLGLAWGVVGNTTPTSTLFTFHIFKDPTLLSRVRDEIETSFGSQDLLDINPSELIKQPLLSSAYAEILRLFIDVFFMVTSAHKDVPLGSYQLPKGRIALINSGISHKDDSFWNTRNGEHPVTSFWAERFLIDPSDPLSGPIAPGVYKPQSRGDSDPDDGGKAPYFSLKGTEGSWFPYGGGHSICPGRVLAKSAVLFVSVLLARDYDIEPLVERIETTNWRCGLGAEQIKHAIPFRIRKRRR